MKYLIRKPDTFMNTLNEEINSILKRSFDSIFPEAVVPGSPAAFFRWLPLPQLDCNGMELERVLLRENINVYASYRFTVLRNPEGFLRIAISSPSSVEELRNGLLTLRKTLDSHRVY